MAFTPFAEVAATDTEDAALVARIRAGDREALEALLGRHQPWIYNLLVRMLYYPNDALDATQDVLLKVLTRLSTFEARSSFRTWLYRLVVNHALNAKRQAHRRDLIAFEVYARELDETPERDLPDPTAVPADVQLLIDEARIGCTSGMLLCLDREQRLVYILGGILGAPDSVGAALLEVSRDAFRQKLARARRDLHRFMHGQCGLVNTANPCRCARKTEGFIAAGYLDPDRLLFAREHLTRVHEVAPLAADTIDELDVAYGAIHRDHPFHDAPGLAGALACLLDGPAARALLDR
jgi:RNA polymerase sigma factor (sigma-70 family)